MRTNSPILYAEDDENDAFLMQRAFRKLDLAYPLQIVGDGKEAISYLSGAAPFSNREQFPLPCLVFLDLNMPKKHGLQVLEWIRAQPTFTHLPVIVFTSSNQLSDISRAKALGASGFLIKPGDPEVLQRILKSVEQRWLSDEPAPFGFADLSLFGLLPESAR